MPTRGVRREALLLGAILLLATVLRVGWPRLSEFKFSEARLEALALEVTQYGRIPLVGVPSSAGFDHSPLSVYLYLPAFLWTANPIPATIYGGLVNVAAVALCWFLARRWAGGSHLAAAIAALLLAASPWAVAFSRKIWQVAFVPLLALAFVGLVVSALVQGRQWRLAWAVAVYGILVQVHPSTIALAPALLLWLLLFRRQVSPGPLLAGAALAALGAVPFALHQVQAGWPALRALQGQSAATWDLAGLRLAWEAITGRSIHALAGNAYPLLRSVPQFDWVFSLVGWVAVASGGWLVWQAIGTWRSADKRLRERGKVDIILATWLLVPVLFTLRHSLELHLHFFAFLIPAACLLVGRALQRILETLQDRRWAAAGAVGGLGALAFGQVAALVLMGVFVGGHDTPGGFGQPLGAYLADIERALDAAAREGATEILVVGQGDSPTVDEVPAIFDVLLRGQSAYRFVDGASTALFPTARAIALLAPGAGPAVEWYASYPGKDLDSGYRLAKLDGSWPNEAFSVIASPRTLQNGVELQGYSLDGLTAEDEATTLWLLWQVLWLDSHNTHVYVRLLDSSDVTVAQDDSPGYPTELRHKGDRIISRFELSAAPQQTSGPYTANIGMYAYPEMYGVPTIDGAGNPVADGVVVGPLPVSQGAGG